MSWGMRVKRAGQVEQDLTTNLGRIIGRVQVTGSGSLTDPALLTGTPDYYVEVLSSSGIPAHLGVRIAPSVSISGDQLSWTYPVNSSGDPLTMTCVIVYWVS